MSLFRFVSLPVPPSLSPAFFQLESGNAGIGNELNATGPRLLIGREAGDHYDVVTVTI